MDISNDYTIKTYKVLDENTNQFSSTAISGGGYDPITNTIKDIHATSVLHSLQSVWMKDTDTGREQKFDFSSFNISARPGHEILIAQNINSGKIERIINLTTNTTYDGDGIYNSKAKINAALYITYPGLYAIMYAIPFIASILFLQYLSNFFSFDLRKLDNGGKGSHSKPLLAFQLIACFIFSCWAIGGWMAEMKEYSYWVSHLIFGAVVGFTIGCVELNGRAKHFEKHTQLLDQEVANFLLSLKTKEPEPAM